MTVTTREWLDAARSDRRMTAAARETVTALVPYVDSDGRVEPDAVKMAKDLGMAESSMYVRLKRLVETEYLLYAPSVDSRAHAYQITTPKRAATLEVRVSDLEQENAELRATLDAVVSRLDELERENRQSRPV